MFETHLKCFRKLIAVTSEVRIQVGALTQARPNPEEGSYVNRRVIACAESRVCVCTFGSRSKGAQACSAHR
jgi:hypothetical protein